MIFYPQSLEKMGGLVAWVSGFALGYAVECRSDTSVVPLLQHTQKPVPFSCVATATILPKLGVSKSTSFNS